MIYHIARNNTRLGTYEEEEIPDALFDGLLLLTDLAWCPGMKEWEPLSEIVQIEEINPGAHAAQAVGAATVPPAMPGRASPPPPPPPFTGMSAGASGLSITSLVLGIASICGGFITGIPAVILGILALKKINASGGAIGGRGLAVGGIACGGALMIFGTAFMAGLLVPMTAQVQERARQMQAMNNVRQIMIALKTYGADNNGLYPDSDPRLRVSTSNQVFRELFRRGMMVDEKIFSSSNTGFEPDGNIGTAPDFEEALKPGENAWAMMKGLSDSASGNAPFIFECPNDAVWPPTWNADAAGQKVQGRAWHGGKIIIGRNDGSVASEMLESVRGARVPLKPRPDGRTAFDESPTHDVLMPE